MAERAADPLLWREYSKELSDFLARRLGVAADSLPRAGGWAGSGNSIGALALRLGIMTLDQVEEVVDLQAADGELFGELAVALGLCESRQVEQLLELQRLHRCLDQAALLVLERRLETPELLRLLADFAERDGLR